ncbi:hypothetical protein NE237_013487 [Protea cynaroides]|uniref:Uncharacterized protein n=1 Tax=Protea cynaroides TaxID=273540 RepID=A0A9Q0JXX0_9MAGN|nr:hypothetical protein NE237_013487 [Protea cynaroides]
MSSFVAKAIAAPKLVSAQWVPKDQIITINLWSARIKEMKCGAGRRFRRDTAMVATGCCQVTLPSLLWQSQGELTKIDPVLLVTELADSKEVPMSLQVEVAGFREASVNLVG